MPSIPQTYTISDIIEWHSKGQLVLDPEFQRGSVWTPTAKVFLIDTILNDLPLPQIFLRTKVNPTSQITIREVVDGQQRLRTILEFASGKLRLSYKAQSFKGKYYKDLELSDQESFLAYRIPVVQLLNATDADVLEVFARLNSYSVKVTPAELRHAEYSEPVKWAIYHATRDWSSLWSDYGIVSVRDSVRLKNTSVIAELFMILDEGFNDGGETRINSYYKTHKTCDEEYFLPFRTQIDKIVKKIITLTEYGFEKTTFFDAPNFLSLFASIAFLQGVSSGGRASEGIENYNGKGVDWNKALENLARIAQAFETDQADIDRSSQYASFLSATKSSTHRVSSRGPRMRTIVEAIAAHGVK